MTWALNDETRAIEAALAGANWHRLSTTAIYAEAQAAKTRLLVDDYHETPVPGAWEGSADDYAELGRYHDQCIVDAATRELKRRERLNRTVNHAPDRELIISIKERIPVADVLEWYTQVFATARDQFKYRCTLHGDDRNPSGVVYVTENQWHCFTCQRHGDVIDAVCAYENISTAAAIAKLARHIGLDVTINLTGKAPKVQIDSRRVRLWNN